MRLVLPLRQRVLRAHQQIDEIVTDGDRSGVHFAAFDETGAIVGVASLHDEREAAAEPIWRLRGMAIDERCRGEGVGRAVMDEVLDFIATSGGGLFWCNARLPAVGFYEKFGFVTVGEEFEEPVIGRHVRMERVVEGYQHTEAP